MDGIGQTLEKFSAAVGQVHTVTLRGRKVELRALSIRDFQALLEAVRQSSYLDSHDLGRIARDFLPATTDLQFEELLDFAPFEIEALGSCIKTVNRKWFEFPAEATEIIEFLNAAASAFFQALKIEFGAELREAVARREAGMKAAMKAADGPVTLH